jgi:hypothetical protein
MAFSFTSSEDFGDVTTLVQQPLPIAKTDMNSNKDEKYFMTPLFWNFSTP